MASQYESNVNGRLDLFRQALEEGRCHHLLLVWSRFPGVIMREERTTPKLSPDGLWLLYPVYAGDGGSATMAELVRVPLSGGAPQSVLRAALYDAPRCAKLPANLRAGRAESGWQTPYLLLPSIRCEDGVRSW